MTSLVACHTGQSPGGKMGILRYHQHFSKCERGPWRPSGGNAGVQAQEKCSSRQGPGWIARRQDWVDEHAETGKPSTACKLEG